MSIGNTLLHFSLATTLSQQQDAGIHDVLKNVRHYNCLFAGGACIFILQDAGIHDVLKNVRHYNCLFAGGACIFILVLSFEGIVESYFLFAPVSWCSLYT
uniref:Uncharacterized protein n=1 Tax=Lactuca sativa TaxID=4236 RepID=A0A9R1UH09_LACSA|nr:hypothetical protein LSAT_V11C900484640 [Lactuca sativa]